MEGWGEPIPRVATMVRTATVARMDRRYGARPIRTMVRGPAFEVDLAIPTSSSYREARRLGHGPGAEKLLSPAWVLRCQSVRGRLPPATAKRWSATGPASTG